MHRWPLAVTALALVLAACLDGVALPQLGFLDRPAPEVIRVMAWNVGAGSVFPAEGQRMDPAGAGRPAQFARVVRAVAPDVLCLQEVVVDAARLTALFNDGVPLGSGETWHVHPGGVDNAIVSRYGFSARGASVAPGGIRPRGHVTALMRLPERSGGGTLWVTCPHFQSSNGPEHIAARQQHADAIVREIREAQRGRGAVPLPPRTPFLILGDLNAVPGLTGFLDQMLAGRVSDDPAVAAGFDWDGTAIADARPSHNGAGPETYTWRNDRDQFPPSALDRVLYSDSVLRIRQAFVLNTTIMSAADLAKAGLQAADVMRDPAGGVHDHLPIVVDFAAVAP